MRRLVVTAAGAVLLSVSAPAARIHRGCYKPASASAFIEPTPTIRMHHRRVSRSAGRANRGRLIACTALLPSGFTSGAGVSAPQEQAVQQLRGPDLHRHRGRRSGSVRFSTASRSRRGWGCRAFTASATGRGASSAPMTFEVRPREDRGTRVRDRQQRLIAPTIGPLATSASRRRRVQVLVSMRRMSS